MSGSVNKAVLLGRVGKDPVLRNLGNGKSVASFSIATSETWKDKSGERQERTTWHNISVFSEGLVRLAEHHVHKGDQVYVEGRINHREYEKDGQKRQASEIVLDGFNSVLTLLGSPSGERREGSSPPASGAAGAGTGGMDEDIPFAPEFR